MIDHYVPRLSSFSGDVDELFVLICVIVGFWFFLTLGMFFWLLFRFRAKDGVPAEYVTGHEKHLHRWVSIPHAIIILCDVVLIAGAIRVWYEVKQFMPEPDVTIGVIAQQWAWTFVHPGLDGKLDTEDDIRMIDELHVQADTTYHFRLESLDVMHSFSIPVFRLKQDAVPGRVILGWFKPTGVGEHDVQCAEMCGIGHGIMGARVIVEDAETHAKWIREASQQQMASR